MKRLKTSLDQGTVDHSEFRMDPHAVAGEDDSFLFVNVETDLRRERS